MLLVFGPGETEDVFCELESGHYFETPTTRSADNKPAAAGKTFHHRTGDFG